MKYYIKSGTLELIYSCNKSPKEAAKDSVWETNQNDSLDEYMYLDERGFRDYISADGYTTVLKTTTILKETGWSLE